MRLGLTSLAPLRDANPYPPGLVPLVMDIIINRDWDEQHMPSFRRLPLEREFYLMENTRTVQ